MARQRYAEKVAGAEPLAYTVDQAARVLMCSKITVMRMMQRRELESFTLGQRGKRIPAASIQAYMARRVEEAATAPTAPTRQRKVG